MVPCCRPRRHHLLEDDQDGPRGHDQRECTDLIFCMVFTVAMALLALAGCVGRAIGEPTRIFFGTDHHGQRCGVGELADKPRIYFPRLSQDLLHHQALLSTSPWALESVLYGVCVRTCPSRGPNGNAEPSSIADPGGERSRWNVGEGTVDILNRCMPTQTQHTSSAVYCSMPTCRAAHEACVELPGHEKHEGLWRVEPGAASASKCARELDVTVREVSHTTNVDGPAIILSQMVGLATNALREIIAARDEVLLCGVGLAVLGGILWLAFLRLCASLAVWAVLVSTAGTMLIASALCALRGGLIPHAIVLRAAAHAASALDSVAVDADDAVAEGIAVAAEHVRAAIDGSSSYLVQTVATAESEQDAAMARWAALILALAGGVYVCVVCMLRSAIRSVVAIVREATGVVAHTPTLLLMPLLSVGGALLLAGAAITTLVNLLTSSPTPDAVASATSAALAATGRSVTGIAASIVSGAYAAIAPSAATPMAADSHDSEGASRGGVLYADADEMQAWNATTNAVAALLSPLDTPSLRSMLVWYCVFGFAWAASTIQCFTQTAMAGAATSCFFHRHDPTERPCCGLPLVAATWRTARYHLGSVALGSLILTLVQVLRVAFEFVAARSKQIPGGDSPLLELVRRCTRACLWCFEQSVRFVTSYAFVLVALAGDSFCHACRDTFGLLTAYPSQAALLRVVQLLLFAAQSLLIPITCALASYRLVRTQLLPSYLVAARAAAAASAERAHAFAVSSWLPFGDAADRMPERGPISDALGWLATFAEAHLMPRVLELGDTLSTDAAGAAGAAPPPTDPMWPAIGTFILAFGVARCFAAVYEVAIDAVFISAMRDQAEYGAVYMSEELREALDLTTPRSSRRRHGKANGRRAEDLV